MSMTRPPCGPYITPRPSQMSFTHTHKLTRYIHTLLHTHVCTYSIPALEDKTPLRASSLPLSRCKTKGNSAHEVVWIGGGDILTCEHRLHVLIVVRCRHNLEADFPASLGVGTCGPEPGTIHVYSKPTRGLFFLKSPRLGIWLLSSGKSHQRIKAHTLGARKIMGDPSKGVAWFKSYAHI